MQAGKRLSSDAVRMKYVLQCGPNRHLLLPGQVLEGWHGPVATHQIDWSCFHSLCGAALLGTSHHKHVAFVCIPSHLLLFAACWCVAMHTGWERRWEGDTLRSVFCRSWYACLCTLPAAEHSACTWHGKHEMTAFKLSPNCSSVNVTCRYVPHIFATLSNTLQAAISRKVWPSLAVSLALDHTTNNTRANDQSLEGNMAGHLCQKVL